MPTTSVKFVPGPRTPETPQAATSVKFVPGPRTPETPQAATSVKFVPGPRTPEAPQATTSVKFVPGPRTPEAPQATTSVKFVPGPRTPNREPDNSENVRDSKRGGGGGGLYVHDSIGIFRDFVRDHVQEFTDVFCEAEERRKATSEESSTSEPKNTAILPLPPKRWSQLTNDQLRQLIPCYTKILTGHGQPGWGKPGMQPSWWPIPLVNDRPEERGIQKARGIWILERGVAIHIAVCGEGRHR
ncbi:uncharacterized protein LOC144915116 [Branchiostoma floridae x Branchiostoma belcheri]